MVGVKHMTENVSTFVRFRMYCYKRKTIKNAYVVRYGSLHNIRTALTKLSCSHFLPYHFASHLLPPYTLVNCPSYSVVLSPSTDTSLPLFPYRFANPPTFNYSSSLLHHLAPLISPHSPYSYLLAPLASHPSYSYLFTNTTCISLPLLLYHLAPLSLFLPHPSLSLSPGPYSTAYYLLTQSITIPFSSPLLISFRWAHYKHEFWHTGKWCLIPRDW